MKIKDEYDELKKQHQEQIVLIKVGSFYVTYSCDAMLLQYLFAYQIKNDKLGFPITALEKVIANLQEKNISFYITDHEKENSYTAVDNTYPILLQLAQKNYYQKRSNDILLERIKLLISSDCNQYNRIKAFIDEL